MSVGLSMIVRNEADLLRRCLQSVRPAVDEMVVADTGSADPTREVARACGARVVEIPWQDDFAAARNQALAELRSDWVLTLDADEMLDPAAPSRIRRLAAGREVAGYQVPIRNYMRSLQERIWDRPAQPNDGALAASRAFPAYVDHENVRLFRRRPGIYFVGRVHESVGPRIESLGLPLGRAGFLIHHFGLAADEDARARKNRLYRELGRKKAQEMPENAQAQLELGLAELENSGEVAQALASFECACRLDPRLGVAWFFAAVAQSRLGRSRAALGSLERAEGCGQDSAAAAEMRGDAHYDLGEFEPAVRAYRQALQREPQAAPLRSKLGLALGRAGEVGEGLRNLRQSIERSPAAAAGHDRLIQLLVWLGRGAEAAVAAENKLRAVPATGPADFQRCAALWAGQGAAARAAAILHVGLQLHPANELLRQSLQELSGRAGTVVDQIAAALQASAAPKSQD